MRWIEREGVGEGATSRPMSNLSTKKYHNPCGVLFQSPIVIFSDLEELLNMVFFR